MLQIDPNAWLVTLPITIGLVQLFFQPADHPIRKLLKGVVQVEAEVWSRLTMSDVDSAASRTIRVGRFVHCFATVCMAVASLASLGAFVGLPVS